MGNILSLGPFFGPVSKDYHKFFVGFDDQLLRMNKLHEDVTKNIPSYPPYNICKVGADNYIIELAIAGFRKSDIDIELAEDKLTIRGNVKEENMSSYLHRGIANRAFTRTFVIDTQMEVKNAEMADGMLRVALERIVPDAKKPKKIMIDGDNSKKIIPQFLTE
jgi:molecular chaperone IbpA